MASHNRYQEHLMRQRGAANRHVTNADFGLSFGFGSSRHDRQLMRQRGAGNRQADNVDFGLSFRTPASSRRSIAVRRSREPSQPRSRRSASTVSDSGRRSTSIAQEATAVKDASRSAKRRRLAIVDDNSDKAPQKATRPSLEAQPRSPSPIFPVAEIPEGEPQSGFGDDAALGAINNRPGLHAGDYGQEEDRSRQTKPASRRKKRKSIGQQSLRRKKRSSGNSVQSQALYSTTASSHREHEAETEHFDEPSIEEQPSVDTGANAAPRPFSSVPKPQRRRRKRKSVNLSKKRRSDQGVVRSVAETQLDRSPDNLDDDADSSADAELNSTIQAMNTSPIVSSPLRPHRTEDEDSEDEYIDEGHSPEPPTPAPPRRDRKGNQAVRNAPAAARRTPARAKTGESRRKLPVTTHRMSHFDSLPTIKEEGLEGVLHEDEVEQQPERNAVLERGTPNTVEVLAQVCQETVDGAIARLETNGSASERRADRKRKIQALETIGDDLGNRLFDMATAVENRINLEGRVRRAKRRKADLQARWIQIRREREKIALKCDLVRRQHWEEEQEREGKWQISDLAHKAEIELERGHADGEESLEYTLRKVAASVSNKAPGGGLLHRIRKFNAELEAMAGVLEGRAS